MTRWPREHQDEDCGCAWKTDPIDTLCSRCKRIRLERDEERLLRQAEENYTDED